MNNEFIKQNVIDIEFISQRQQEIKKRLHQFLDDNNIKEIYVYVSDINNSFLDISTSPFKYIQQYKQTKIITPAIINEHDINKTDLSNIDYLIIFEQKETVLNNSLKNNIEYHIGTYKNKSTFFITFITSLPHYIFLNTLPLYTRTNKIFCCICNI